MSILSMTRSKRTGIRAKIVRVFAIQVGIISLGILLGIYITQSIIFGVVMREALNAEVEHYWTRAAENPDHALPDVYNLRGFMAIDGNLESVPAQYRTLESIGFHEMEVAGRQALIHVSEQNGKKLFLVFEADQVSDVAFFFGIVPLAVVLVLIYGLSFLTYRMSQRAVSPVVRLADYLENFDFEGNRQLDLDLDSMDAVADAEVATMIEAMGHFRERLNSFIERERIFTRDAGHELRTPVAVFKGSLDLLEQVEDRPAFELKALKRMRRTVSDMESLLQTLLMLAREEDTASPSVEVDVNQAVANQLDLVQESAEKGNNQLQLHESARLRVMAPQQVVEIVLGNLIRNAVNYTQNGEVSVTVEADKVTVKDTGVGMSGAELNSAFEPFYRADESRGLIKGHGLGLSIVKRLVHQFGWSISVYSRPGEGTSIAVTFR
jgi:signal transduction histidine kinase